MTYIDTAGPFWLELYVLRLLNPTCSTLSLDLILEVNILMLNEVNNGDSGSNTLMVQDS